MIYIRNRRQYLRYAYTITVVETHKPENRKRIASRWVFFRLYSVPHRGYFGRNELVTNYVGDIYDTFIITVVKYNIDTMYRNTARSCLGIVYARRLRSNNNDGNNISYFYLKLFQRDIK